MPITVKDVEKIAKLAKLSFSEEEKEKFSRQLGQIIDYVEKLKELNTETVLPTYHVVAVHNVFRRDEVEPSMPREDVLKNAPAKKRGYFSVPKVIAQE
jgi:aspartyl-tRNA(Asn)/glutamyl-tRNA(Gln) amidotransferase subunit C